MKYTSLFYFIFLVLLFSCTNDSNSDTSNGSTSNQEAVQVQKSNLSQFFDPTVVTALSECKAAFDLEVRKGFHDRPLAYVYDQHALRMKLDLLNNEPFQYVFPYNGKYRLKNFPDAVNKVPFLTNKCGFQREKNGEIINYLCLNLNESFFAYLGQLGEKSTLIAAFVESYQEHKTITSDIKRMMLLDSEKELDFSQEDHQIFYFLFHSVANEEYWASKLLQESVR